MVWMSGKRAFLELLKQEGVDLIFGNPGTTELPLMDALAAEDEIRYVLGLQEAAVLSMADGYAQASGRLGVVNLHVTPGLGNALGMLYDAQKAGAPLLVTAGQHDQSFTATEPILWGDLPTIARPFVKWSSEVRRLADLPRMVHRAAKAALAPPTGPVFLSLPVDVLNAEGEIALGAPTRVPGGMRADAAAIADAAALIAAAERPVIIAGDAVAQSRAHAEVAALAELIGAPVYLETVFSTASFPTSHPLYKGPINRLAPLIRKALDPHDLLLSVGGDLFTLSLPSDIESVPPGLRIVHLDGDPWELGKNYPVTALLGDVKATLPELTTAVAAKAGGRTGQWRERGAAAKRAIAADRAALIGRARDEAAKTPMRALALLQAVGEMLPPDAVVVEETLSSIGGLRELIRSDDPQSFFGMRGGGIGWGLPAAIGVKLALPQRPVVALIGDGSAMYTCQALWTAAHSNVAVTYLILNNRSYRILKQRTQALRGSAAQTGSFIGMELTGPAIDFPGLARSLGVAGETVRTLPELRDALGRALAGGRPALIDAEIDPAL
jgi:benzoylformate decarboxylase